MGGLSGSGSTNAIAWNGPVCPACRRGYIGNHQCSIVDLQAIIDELQRKIDELRNSSTVASSPVYPWSWPPSRIVCTTNAE